MTSKERCHTYTYTWKSEYPLLCSVAMLDKVLSDVLRPILVTNMRFIALGIKEDTFFIISLISSTDYIVQTSQGGMTVFF